MVNKVKSLKKASDGLREAVEDLSKFQMLVLQARDLMDEHANEIPVKQRENLSVLLKGAGRKSMSWMRSYSITWSGLQCLEESRLQNSSG
jgi:hypothetical protein